MHVLLCLSCSSCLPNENERHLHHDNVVSPSPLTVVRNLYFVLHANPPMHRYTISGIDSSTQDSGAFSDSCPARLKCYQTSSTPRRHKICYVIRVCINYTMIRFMLHTSSRVVQLLYTRRHKATPRSMHDLQTRKMNPSDAACIARN